MALTFLRLYNFNKHLLTRPEMHKTRAISGEVVDNQARIPAINMKHAVVSHFQFIDFVVGTVFIDDKGSDVGIAVDVIDRQFCEAIAKHRVISFVDNYRPVREALVGIRVVNSACRPRFETCEEE